MKKFHNIKVFLLVLVFVFGIGYVSSVVSAAVLVFVSPRAPLIDIKANPRNVNVGSSSTITWSTNFVSHGCTKFGDWSGQDEGMGTYVTGPLSLGTHTYGLSCFGHLNRPSSASVTVRAR